MAETWYGVDDATPPTEQELASLNALGARWVGIYVGGINNGGRAWTPSDSAAVSKAGYERAGIYVGENVCSGCSTPPVFTLAQGSKDGRDAVAHANAFGLAGQPLALDLEASSTVTTANGWEAYAQGWTQRVAELGGNPGIYLSLAGAGDYHPVTPTWLWLASWDDKPGFSAIPNPAKWSALAHQYSDNWHGFDGSIAQATLWTAGATKPPESQVFSTGFTAGGGFYRYWAEHGGIYAFGMPISREYKTTVGGDSRTRQWYERAVLTWKPGQWPSQYDVIPLLLGYIIRNGGQPLAMLQADYLAHKTAFQR